MARDNKGIEVWVQCGCRGRSHRKEAKPLEAIGFSHQFILEGSGLKGRFYSDSWFKKQNQYEDRRGFQW
jgi:hypothetical protein